MKLFWKSLILLLKSLLKCGEEGFSISDCSAKSRKCFNALVSYYCDISEARNIFTAIRESMVYCPCVRCLLTVTDICHFGCRESRSSNQARVVRIYTIEKVKETREQSKKGNKSKHRKLIEREKQMQRTFLVSSRESSFESCNLVPWNKSLFLCFKMESLYDLQPGILKQVKKCAISYLSSVRLKTKRDALDSRRKSLKVLQNGLQKVCDLACATFKKEYYTPALHIDFLRKRFETQLNRLFGVEWL